MGVTETLKRGVTELVLLGLLTQQDMYGYEMAQALRDRIDRAIHAITGIHMTVDLVEPQTLERAVGKSKRVRDRRREKAANPPRT